MSKLLYTCTREIFLTEKRHTQTHRRLHISTFITPLFVRCNSPSRWLRWFARVLVWICLPSLWWLYHWRRLGNWRRGLTTLISRRVLIFVWAGSDTHNSRGWSPSDSHYFFSTVSSPTCRLQFCVSFYLLTQNYIYYTCDCIYTYILLHAKLDFTC